MATRQLYLVSYDIRDNRKRREALITARQYATGGQKSVHECWLTEHERNTLANELSVLIDDHTDRALILRLDPRQRVYVLGCAVAPLPADFFYIG